ncbi:MAG: response regulator transcription factor [Acidimicrobiales bacterium]
MRNETCVTQEPSDDQTGPVTVLIVDDQPPFRTVARTVVGVTSGFEVIGEAESGEAAVDAVAELHPQLVLMDINLGGITGIEATRRIVAAAPETVVILMSTYDESALPADAATCGAARYVHKEDFGPAVLREVWAQ